jgi:ankyrin repeat protein
LLISVNQGPGEHFSAVYDPEKFQELVAFQDFDTMMVLLAGNPSLDPTSAVYIHAIYWSIVEDNAFVLRCLCLKSGDIDVGNPLHWAAHFGKMKCLRLLLAMSADVNSLNNDYNTPLEIALDQQKHAAAVELLQRGAEWTSDALVYASRAGYLDIVRSLVDMGADINEFSSWRASALGKAFMCDDPNVADFLLGCGADLCSWGDLECAADVDHHGDCLDDLVHSIVSEGVRLDVDGIQERSINVLETALRGHHHTTALFLIQRGAICMLSADSLGLAAEAGFLDVVQIMLAKGLGVDDITSGTDPDRSQMPALRRALLCGRQDVAIYLIEAGADSAVYGTAGRDSHGTALQIAAREGFADVARALLAHGVSGFLDEDARVAPPPSEGITLWDPTLRTPLQLALDNKHHVIAAMLIQAGADVTKLIRCEELARLPFSTSAGAQSNRSDLFPQNSEVVSHVAVVWSLSNPYRYAQVSELSVLRPHFARRARSGRTLRMCPRFRTGSSIKGPLRYCDPPRPAPQRPRQKVPMSCKTQVTRYYSDSSCITFRVQRHR